MIKSQGKSQRETENNKRKRAEIQGLVGRRTFRFSLGGNCILREKSHGKKVNKQLYEGMIYKRSRRLPLKA